MKRMLERPNYPPTPDQYLEAVKKFRRLPKERGSLGLTWIEKTEEWN